MTKATIDIPESALKATAAWLRAGGGQIGDNQRAYRQNDWDCGTACCAAGALHLACGLGPANDRPDALLDSLCAKGGGYAVAASLCGCGDPRVGPIIAALLEGGDGEAEAAAARAAGFQVWLSGEATASKGVARCYGSCSVTVSGGEARCHNSCSVTVSRGVARCYGSCSVTVSGGEARCHNSCSVTVSRGVARCYGSCSVTVSGGVANCYGSCSVTVSGGLAGCYGSCSVTVTGGEAWCYDSCSVTVTGGEAWCHNSCVVNHLGGRLVRRVMSSGRWQVESDTTKPALGGGE